MFAPDREPRPTSGPGPEIVEPTIAMPSERVATPDENRVCDAGTFESVVDEGTQERVRVVEAEIDDSRDRRGTARIPYDRRVVALGEEAARVLVGRDLSPGGMRIDATPSVALGDLLRVALHSGNQSEPIIVLAHVLRDDGDAGLVLVFTDLSPRQKEQLEQIIDCSGPIHVNPDPFEDEDESPFPVGPIVVAEMLDTVARDVADSSRLSRSDFASFVDAGKSVEDSR